MHLLHSGWITETILSGYCVGGGDNSNVVVLGWHYYYYCCGNTSVFASLSPNSSVFLTLTLSPAFSYFSKASPHPLEVLLCCTTRSYCDLPSRYTQSVCWIPPWLWCACWRKGQSATQGMPPLPLSRCALHLLSSCWPTGRWGGAGVSEMVTFRKIQPAKQQEGLKCLYCPLFCFALFIYKDKHKPLTLFCFFLSFYFPPFHIFTINMFLDITTFRCNLTWFSIVLI